MALNTYTVTAADNNKCIPLRGDMDIAMDTAVDTQFAVRFLTEDFSVFTFKSVLGFLNNAGNITNAISIGARPNTSIEFMFDPVKSTWRITSSNVVQPLRRWIGRYSWEMNAVPTIALVGAPTTVVLSGAVTLTAAVTSLSPVGSVALYRDGTLLTTLIAPPYLYKDTVDYPLNGNHVYQAVVTTKDGQTVVSDPVNIMVSIPVPLPPDTTPPAVSVSTSLANVEVATSLKITASATDDRGVTKVEFLRNGQLFSTAVSSPYTANQTITDGDNGIVQYSANAYDAAGNKTTSDVVFVSVNILPPASVSSLTLDSTLTAAVQAAMDAATIGSKRLAGVNAIISTMAPAHSLNIYRDGVTIFNVQFSGDMTVYQGNDGIGVGLGDVTSGTAKVAADITTGVWTFILTGGSDGQRTIQGTVGPAGSDSNIILSDSPFQGQEFDAVITFIFDPSIDGVS